MPVTINAISIPDQTQTQITLNKTGPAEGTINTGNRTFTLTNITASADGLNMKCKGNGVADVTCTVQPHAPPASSFLTVGIAGTIFFDGTTNYQISAADEQKLVKFIKDSHFPQLLVA
jgi:hypothetical protein